MGNERNNPRVLHVVEAFGGGVLEMLDVLTSRLCDAGFETGVAFGVRPETPADVRQEMDPRVDLIPLPWTGRTALATVRATRTIRGTIKTWSPDVVHLHSSFAGAVGALVVPRGVVAVYSPHGYAFSMPHSAYVARAVMGVEWVVARRVSVVAAVSESEAIEARRVRAPRIRVVTNGIPELDRPTALVKTTDKKNLVVAAGRPVAQRQPRQVARILGAVRDIAEVTWIGGGYEASGDAAELARAGIPVTGWLPRSKAMDLLGAAMVYLHWTAWDGLPLSILEAVARDVVVVAHDIPSSREILGSGQVCNTEAEAVDLIRRIMREPGYRAELLSRQRERGKLYGADLMTQRWMSLYREMSTTNRTLGGSKGAP